MKGKGDLVEDIMFSRSGDIVQRPTFDHFLNLMFFVGFLDPGHCVRKRYRSEKGPLFIQNPFDTKFVGKRSLLR